MISTETTVRVRYAETDKMGVVYHGNYFAWYEVGRVHMLDELGLPYTRMEEEGYMLPVIEAHTQYLRPARFDDVVTIRTMMREVPGVRFIVEYELFVQDKLIAKASTKHAFVTTQGQPTRPPLYIREKFREVLQNS